MWSLVAIGMKKWDTVFTPQLFSPVLYEYIDTDSADMTTWKQIMQACVFMPHAFSTWAGVHCLSQQCNASLGPRACMWWMIQRIQAVWITYEVPIVQSQGEQWCKFPHMVCSNTHFFGVFSFHIQYIGYHPRTKLCVIWPCICHLSQTIIITPWRSHPSCYWPLCCGGTEPRSQQ